MPLFHYLMDLHYSQTRCMTHTMPWVSLPYGFTLFSNAFRLWQSKKIVSLPYGFTLFSNRSEVPELLKAVSLPYGFTLFSNLNVLDLSAGSSFTTLWIYTILKPGCPVLRVTDCFTTLWIYTILKPYISGECGQICFTTLWIYTILKPDHVEVMQRLVSLPYGFTLFSNWRRKV